MTAHYFTYFYKKSFLVKNKTNAKERSIFHYNNSNTGFLS